MYDLTANQKSSKILSLDWPFSLCIEPVSMWSGSVRSRKKFDLLKNKLEDALVYGRDLRSTRVFFAVRLAIRQFSGASSSQSDRDSPQFCANFHKERWWKRYQIAKKTRLSACYCLTKVQIGTPTTVTILLPNINRGITPWCYDCYEFSDLPVSAFQRTPKKGLLQVTGAIRWHPHTLWRLCLLT